MRRVFNRFLEESEDTKKTFRNYLTFKTGKYNVLIPSTVKLGNKELFDKEQIGIKEPFPVTNLPFTSQK